MRQWQCPCGAWVDMSRPKHIHRVIERQPTAADMRRLRMLGQDALALEPIGELIETKWSPDFARRDKPNE